METKLPYRNIVSLIAIFTINTLHAQTVLLTGTVKTGSEVLQSATVSVANQSAITDRNGRFSFYVSPATYTLVVSYVGYKKTEKSITVTKNEINNIEIEMFPNGQLEEITILGSRTGLQRSNLNTPVPIDVFSSEKLFQTNQPSTIQALNYLSPSFNADGQKLNEPVTYRGTDPDHLLILLNNSRYHNSAWLGNGVPKTDLGRGSVYNDLNSIPSSAIDKIEILRDGASAQYGSDAISGVLNFRLKESTGKTSIRLGAGQYYAGDGLKTWLGIYRGYDLNKKGFISFAADFRTQAPTTRAGEFWGLAYSNWTGPPVGPTYLLKKAEDDSLLFQNGIDKKEFTKNNGTTQLHSFGMLVNGAYRINSHIKLFWTGTGNYRTNCLWAIYRYPRDSSRLNKFLFPNGVRPRSTADNWDFTAIAGLKGDTRNNWHWELSSSFGNNTSGRHVYNSNNATQEYTLGADAPTSFYLGSLIYNLFTNNINFTKDLSKKKGNLNACDLNIGAEWRLENYQMKAGDEAATENYDTTFVKQPGSQPSVGGVSVKDVVNKNRSVSALYCDIEFEPSNRFLIDVAGRYEYYSDFGGNLAGKIAMRFKFSPRFSLRSSISNGYRAPALQQRYFSGNQTYRGSGYIQRVFSNESELTKAFHIPSLTAEKAMNLSLGFASKASRNISFTADAYLVQIKNRIVLSGVFDTRDPQIADILRKYPGVDFVQFYTNAINTRTYGFDLVLNGNWNINKTSVGLTLAANVNRHSIFGPVKTTDVVKDTTRYINTLFGLEERTTLKKDQPGEKIIFSAVATRDKFGFTFRNTFFGNTAYFTVQPNGIDLIYETFSSKILTDFSINYSPKNWVTITVGANNIFDVYPDRLKDYRNTSQGITLYSAGSSPFGFNGGYYFVNMNFGF